MRPPSVLRFNEGETLVVEHPTGISVADDGLRIAQARRVRWEWLYYGRPKTEANRLAIEYPANSSHSFSGFYDAFTPQHST
jgi:hypothetical protein